MLPESNWTAIHKGAYDDHGNPIGTLNPNIINDPEFIKDFGDKNDFLPKDKGQWPNNVKFDKDILGDGGKFFHKKQGTKISNRGVMISKWANK